jgi:hypothetical protein
MQRKTIYGLFVAVLLVAVSFGFFKIVNNDPTTAASFSTYRSAEQTPKYTGDNPLLGTWSVGTVVPTPTSYGGAGVGYSRNDTCWLYAVNGDTNGSSGSAGTFRKYNINTNTWTPLPPAQGRCWTSATKIGSVSNTNIYTLGGLPSGASAWTSLTGTLQKYSINTNTWTAMLDAPVAVGSPGLCGYQDSLLYAIGGQGTAGVPITNVQLYNAVSNTWRTATPLPAPRANGWMVIRNDTIYYGCGASSGTVFENNIYVGKISSADRSVITWTVSAVTYPGVSRHRMDADMFAGGFFIGPGAGATWWGAGNDAYTWNGGSSAFVSVGPVPVATSDAYVGTGSFQRGSYRIWKAVVASGLILAAPYSINNNQIYTDSVFSPPPVSNLCEGFNSVTFPPTNWSLTGTATTLWSYNAVSGFGSGTGSAKADFYNVSTGSQQLITLTFTPSVLTDSLIFQDAYATFATENDQLEVLTSTNGGTNWVSLVMLNGGVSGELVTAPPQTAVFTPTAGQWKYQKKALPVGTNKVQFNGITAFGNNLYIDSICVKHTVTGISPYEGTPKSFSLSQNYPNPFNPTTKINFALPKQGFVTLKIYDMLGREVRTLVNEVKSAGNFTVDFNASELSSGIYFYKLETNGFSDIKKMMLIK